MKLLNCINTLPWHSTRRWLKRELSEIEEIVIHQEAGNGSVENVNNYHITPGQNNHVSKAGCPHFCYHYGIEKDGTIKQVNLLTDITWHTGNVNRIGIGIMLVGNFSGPDHKGDEKPTPAQMTALEELVDYLQAAYGPLRLKGHFDYGKPSCPGTFVENWIKEKRK